MGAHCATYHSANMAMDQFQQGARFLWYLHFVFSCLGDQQHADDAYHHNHQQE